MAAHVPRFAMIATPLRRAIKTARAMDKERKGGARPSNVLFPLEGAEAAAFTALIEAVVEAPPLIPFDKDAPSTVVSDASACAIAAYLIQNGRIVALFSKPLTEVQARWKAFDLEAHALTQALHRWEHWLKGRPVTCISDHKGLSVLTNLEAASTKVLRWVERLTAFNVEIHHVAGTDPVMALADWLSRPNTPLQTEPIGAMAKVGGAVARTYDVPSPTILALRSINAQYAAGRRKLRVGDWLVRVGKPDINPTGAWEAGMIRRIGPKPSRLEKRSLGQAEKEVILSKRLNNTVKDTLPLRLENMEQYFLSGLLNLPSMRRTFLELLLTEEVEDGRKPSRNDVVRKPVADIHADSAMPDLPMAGEGASVMFLRRTKKRPDLELSFAMRSKESPRAKRGCSKTEPLPYKLPEPRTIMARVCPVISRRARKAGEGTPAEVVEREMDQEPEICLEGEEDSEHHDAEDTTVTDRGTHTLTGDDPDPGTVEQQTGTEIQETDVVHELRQATME